MKYIIFFIFIFWTPLVSLAQWYPVPVPTLQSLEMITFTDSLRGYVYLSDGTMMETSDGGVNWQIVPTGSTSGADLSFPTASTGYGDGNNGIVVKTTNAGISWSVINSPTTNVLRGVFFLNPDTGFICGQQQHIFRTTDGGVTWVQQTTGSYWLRQFSFPTPQIGYCAGDGLLIYKTTNGGVTWVPLTAPGGTNLNDIQFLTVDTGYVCGLTGYCAKSFNGGQTWQILNTGTTIGFEALWFFNSQSGYCVGSSGLILKTTDGGASWTQETSGTSNVLRRAYFFNPNNGFICGGNATLLRNSCLPQAGYITGQSSVCQGDFGKVYSVNPVTGATGYNWNVPPGVIITSGNNTNIITVTFPANSVSGSFSVYAFNLNCNGPVSPNFPVIVNPAPVPVITGAAQVCINSGSPNYTTQPGMTNYSWSVSAGGMITSGSGTNQVQVTWLSPGNQWLNVNYTSSSGCSSLSPGVLNVLVDPLPDPAGPVSGLQSLCAGISNVSYSVAVIPNAISYLWSLPAGAHIVSGAGTNQINVDFDPSAISGMISVHGTNLCGNGDTAFFIVTVHYATIPFITGNDTACQNGQYMYITQSGMSNYQWLVSPGGLIVSGGTTTDDLITVSWISPGNNWVKINFTNSFGCTDTVPVQRNVWVRPEVTVGIAVSASEDTVCSGTQVTYTATASNAGTSPVFQWKVNGINAGTNSPVFVYTPMNGDHVSCVLTSSAYCALGNPATSNVITMVVHPILPVSVFISPSVNPVCAGTLVTFTANPTNPGLSPIYQWKVNGINTGTNNTIYSYIPVNGDTITCILISNAICPTGNPAISNINIMTVNPNLPVGISITASANPVCAAIPITFVASSNNGGLAPVYQWKVNGINVGNNAATYQYTPVNGDIINCTLTSSYSCPTGNPAISNAIIMNIFALPVVTYTLCNDSITTTNAKPFRLKGGIPLGGSYTGAGVSNGIFNPALAGAGNHQITYTYTNAALCSASAQSSVHSLQSAVFSCGNNLVDIRDSKTYATIQIGSQCWMAENLNYGYAIDEYTNQRDNCIPEKYIRNSSSVIHNSFYQWDEIMNYDEVVSTQGLCPPGWHVPSEVDWNTLFANYINNGFAGSPLKYSGFSGFTALLSGSFHLNRTWDFQGFGTFFWSSTSHGTLKAWTHGMNDTDPSVSLYPALKSNAFSVRCLKDD